MGEKTSFLRVCDRRVTVIEYNYGWTKNFTNMRALGYEKNRLFGPKSIKKPEF